MKIRKNRKLRAVWSLTKIKDLLPWNKSVERAIVKGIKRDIMKEVCKWKRKNKLRNKHVQV